MAGAAQAGIPSSLVADDHSWRIPLVTHQHLPAGAAAPASKPCRGPVSLHRTRRLLAGAVVAPALAFAWAPPASAQLALGSSAGRYSFGGGVSAGAGDVSFITVSPYVAYRVTEDIDVGVGLFYRLRHDNRFGRDLDTQDAGGSVFGRYHLPGPFFAQAELEYVNYEVYRSNLTKFRKSATGVLVGGGIAQPLGSNASAHLMVLYNLSYSGYSAPAPYSSPWVLRAGIGVRF
jgi:hypothetical protein